MDDAAAAAIDDEDNHEHCGVNWWAYTNVKIFMAFSNLCHLF